MTPDVVDIAGQALYGLVGDPDHSHIERHLAPLAEHSRHMPAILSAWIDTVVHHVGMCADTPGSLVKPIIANPGGIDEAPPAVAWAARIFAARVAMDQETWIAPMGTDMTDAEYTRGVAHVLSMAAGLIRGDTTTLVQVDR